MCARQSWLVRRDRHRARVDALLGPYLRGRAAGQADPVVDFLFTYYNLSPGRLRRWHPGYGVVLTGPEAQEYAALRGYRVVGDGIEAGFEDGFAVSAEHLGRRRDTIAYVVDLLTATAARPANFSCFGLHEWAMVYRDAGRRRHDLPLRLAAGGTDAVVEALPLRCTHYDAFRFFTDEARPRNGRQLTRGGQLGTEQPGCLHAGMDLYKFAAKLLPLVSSDLVWDAFELAYAARELDMRASPYDLSGYGYDPVCIESATGRAEYVRAQSDLSYRGAGVRTALLTACRELLTPVK